MNYKMLKKLGMGVLLVCVGLFSAMKISASSKEEKAYYMYEQLENCVGLIFRQPMFADFEHRLHEMAKNNEPMSSKIKKVLILCLTNLSILCMILF